MSQTIDLLDEKIKFGKYEKDDITWRELCDTKKGEARDYLNWLIKNEESKNSRFKEKNIANFEKILAYAVELLDKSLKSDDPDKDEVPF